MTDPSCKELVELVNDYLDGALPPAERERFAAHLGTCEACVAFIEQMRTTVAIASRLDEEALDEHTRRELLETFRRWKATGA